jgi:hypothetical protein
VDGKQDGILALGLQRCAARIIMSLEEPLPHSDSQTTPAGRASNTNEPRNREDSKMLLASSGDLDRFWTSSTANQKGLPRRYIFEDTPMHFKCGQPP